MPAQCGEQYRLPDRAPHAAIRQDDHCLTLQFNRGGGARMDAGMDVTMPALPSLFAYSQQHEVGCAHTRSVGRVSKTIMSWQYL